MKKYCLIMACLMVISLAGLISAAWAQDNSFKDLPAKHWAAESVYKLVKNGVVTGFPDGTYRGKKSVTRYEAAVMLSKLSDLIGADTIKADLDQLRKEISSMQKADDLTVAGRAELNGMVANLLSTGGLTDKGPVSNYRLITSVENKIGDQANLSVTLDTMDAGFYGGNALIFPMNLIDIVGDLTLDPGKTGISMLGFHAPVKIVLSAGPGPYQHQDATGFLPSEQGITYDRPRSGLGIATKIFGLNMAGNYFVVSQQASGKVNTNLLSGSVDHTFSAVPWIDSFKLQVMGDYYTNNPATFGPTDKKLTLNVWAPFGPKVQTQAKWGLGHWASTGWIMGAEIKLDDLFQTGTAMMIKGAKVGSNYISSALAADEFNVAGYDIFMRPLQNSQVDIGGEVSQTLTDKILLKGKGDIRLSHDFKYGKDQSNTNLTAQVGVSYDLAPEANLDAFYRIYQDPTISETTDLTGAGLIYKF